MYDISYSPSHHHQVGHKNSQREVMYFRAYVLEMLSHLKGHRFWMKDWHEDKYKFYVSWCQSFVSNYKAVPKFGRLRRLVLWPCLLAWCATLPGVHVGELFIPSRILQQPKLCNCKKKLVGWANIILIPRINLLVRPFARLLVSLDHSNEAECLLKSSFEQ